MVQLPWPADLNPNSLIIMLLMVVRIGAMLVTTPVLGSQTVPAMTKIGIAIVLSFVLLPTTAPLATPPETFGYLILAIGKEMIVGLLAGFAVSLLFASLQMVATIVGIQIGFGFSSTIDTNFAGQSPVLDHLFSGLATVIFFTGNFHHAFLMGIQGLFNIIPPNGFSLERLSSEGLVTLSANMFLVALRIALPLLGALLLADIALGIMARTSPQMNVFFVGMPAKIVIGIFAIVVMLPFVVNGIEALLNPIGRDMALILRYH